MKIKDMYNKNKPVISFEVFPPNKSHDIETIYGTVHELAKFNPDFIFCRLHIIIVGDRALPVPFPGSLCPHLDSHVVVINRHFRKF